MRLFSNHEKNIRLALKLFFLNYAAFLALETLSGSIPHPSHVLLIIEVVLIIVSGITELLVVIGYWSIASAYSLTRLGRVFLFGYIYTLLTLGYIVTAFIYPYIPPHIDRIAHFLFATYFAIILLVTARFLEDLSQVFNAIKVRMQQIWYVTAAVIFIGGLLLMLNSTQLTGNMSAFLLAIVSLTITVLRYFFNLFYLKIGLAGIKEEEVILTPFQDLFTRNFKIIVFTISLFVTLVVFLIMVSNYALIRNSRIKSLNQKLNSQIVLGDKSRFQMKEECEKYRGEAEQRIKEDDSEYGPTNSKIVNYFTEMFYSPKANSCLYLSMELMYSNGNLVMEQPRLVDVLSGEVLFADLREVDGASYNEDKARFDKYVDEYR